MSRDIEIKFKRKKKRKGFFPINFFKKNLNKTSKNDSRLIDSENLKMKATLIDFSPHKFLTQTNENERFEIMKKVFQFCLENNIKSIFCDNKLKDELLKISIKKKNNLHYIQNLNLLDKAIQNKELKNIFLLSCEQNNIFDISLILKKNKIKFSTLKDVILNHLDLTPKSSFINIILH